MKSSTRCRDTFPIQLVLVALVSLALVSTGDAAKKPNRNNNNRAKIEQMRRQMGQRAAAQARVLGQQIKVVDTRINGAQQEMTTNQQYMQRAEPPVHTARSKNEAAKLYVTNAKRELNEVEDDVLDSIPASSPFLAQKSVVTKAQAIYAEVRGKAEKQVSPFAKGVEREKQITAVPAVQQAQQELKRAADIANSQKRAIFKESPSWSGARERLTSRNTEATGTQRVLDQKVSVYNKFRIAANKAQRELKSLLQTKQVLVAQKHAADQTARRYGYYQRPGSKGSGSSRSPGSKSR
ncbi:MAG: hypothetical protein VB855_00960 [Pirellulaceae bacterium]